MYMGKNNNYIYHFFKDVNCSISKNIMKNNTHYLKLNGFHKYCAQVISPIFLN